MAKLVLIDKDMSREVPLGQELTIGRAYSNLLRLDSDEISRVHAIIYRRGIDFVIRDLDSKNGVVVNGARITTKPLADGDIIQVGSFTVLFNPPDDVELPNLVRESSPVSGFPVRRVQTPVSGETSRLFKAGDMLIPPPLPKLVELLDPAEILDDDQMNPEPLLATRLVQFHQRLGQSSFRDASGRSPLQQLLGTVAETVDADRGAIVARVPDSEPIRLCAIYPGTTDVALNRVVLEACLRDGKAVFSPDPQNSPLYQRTQTLRRDNVTSLLAFPINRYETGPFGILYVDKVDGGEPFEKHNLLILAAAAALAATMLQNEEQYLLRRDAD